MTDRTVDLVIRARDEAVAVLQKITTTLAGLKGAQDATGKSAEGTGSLLGQLVTVLGDLDTKARALQQFGKVAAQLDAVGKAVTSVSAASAEANANVNRLKADVESLGSVSAKADAELKATSAALNAQSIAAGNDAKALRSLENQITSTQSKIAGLDAKSASGEALTTTQVERYQLLENRLRSLLTLQENAQRSSAATRANVAELSQTFNVQSAAAQASNDGLQKATKDYAAAEGAANRFAATLERVTAEQGALRASAAHVAAQLGVNIELSDSAAAAASRLADNQARVALALSNARSTPGPASAIGQFGVGGPAAESTANFRAQIAATDDAKRAMQAAQEQATTLGRAIALAGTHNEQLAVDFEIAKVNAETATRAYQSQALALQSLRADLAALNASRRQEQINTAIGEKVLVNQRAEIAQREALDAVIRRNKEAHEALTTALSNHGAVLDNNISTLARYFAAYVGFTQVTHFLKESITAAADYEAAQVRITLALGQGEAAGVATFNHIARSAEDLKVPILDAVNQFGKFQAAVKGTALEGPATIKIFDDLLITARAFKLDPENINRAGIALRDMAANGNINLRYLRQFDQALPVGFLSELAKAAGYSTAQIGKFTEAIHKGQVGLDVLPIAMDNLAKRAQEGLPNALKTAQATFADFQNQIFKFQISLTSSGFLDAIVKNLQTFNEKLASAEGAKGARELGGILAQITNVLATLVSHATGLLAVFTALGAIKLFGTLSGFAGFAQIFGGIAGQIAAIRAATGALSVTLATLGGPIGIILAGLVAAGTAWFVFSNSEDKAATAAADYARVISDMKDKLDGAADAQGRLNDKRAAASLSNIDAAIESTSAAFHQAQGRVGGFAAGQRLAATAPITPEESIGRTFDAATAADRSSLADFADKARTAGLSAKELMDRFNELYATLSTETGREEARRLREELQKLGETTQQYATVAQEAEKAGRSSEKVAEGMNLARTAHADLNAQLKNNTGISEAAAALEKFDEALIKIEAHVPALKAARDITDRAKADADLIEKAKRLDATNDPAGNDTSAQDKARDAIRRRDEAVRTNLDEGNDKQLAQIRASRSGDPKTRAEDRAEEQVRARIDEFNIKQFGEKRALTAEQEKFIRLIREEEGITYNTANAKKIAKDIHAEEKKKLDEIVALESQRKTFADEAQKAFDNGDLAKVDELRLKITDLTARIKEGLPKINVSLLDETDIDKLEKAKRAAHELKGELVTTGKTITESLSSGIVNAFDNFGAAVAKGTRPLVALRDAFLGFASDFLKQIANMILKQALFNAIASSGFGGGIAGGINSLFSGSGALGGLGVAAVAHSGGTVGSVMNQTRQVSTAWFANAPRFHGGGFPGLAPDEVPIIAQRGEEITAKNQVGKNNGAGASSGAARHTFVVALGDDQIAAAMAGSHGEEVTLAHVKRNGDKVTKWIQP